MAMETQLQIRQNAMEVQEYMSELFEWQKSMKKGQKKPAGGKSDVTGSVPGPRGRATSNIAPAPKELQAPALSHTSALPGASKPGKPAANGQQAPVAKTAAAHTYSSYSKWDKLNVDAMLASDEDEDQPTSKASRSTGPTVSTLTPAPPPPGCTLTPSIQARHSNPARQARSRPCSTVHQTQDTPGSTSQQRSPPACTSQPDSSLPPVRNSEPQTAEAWRTRGNDLFKAGQYAYAKDCYTRCLDLDASSAAAWANRAMAELKLSQWAEAEEDCTQAIQLDPTYVKAWHRRGTARKAQSKLLAAAQDFEDAFRLEPTNKSLAADRDAVLAAHMTATKLAGMTQRVRVEITPCAPAVAQQQPGVGPTPSPAQASTVQPGGSASTAHTARSSKPTAVDTAAVSSGRVSSSGGVQGGGSSSSQTSPRSPSQQPAATAVKGKLAAAASAAVQQLSSRLASQVRAPKTSTEFESTWRSLGGDLPSQLAYLQTTQPSQLPQIFKSSLTPQHLVSIISVVLQGVAGGASESGDQGWQVQEALGFLQGLSQVPRVPMAAMCIGSKQKAELGALWEGALGPDKLPASVSAGDCLQLKQLFKL